MDEKELCRKMTTIGCKAIEGKLVDEICIGKEGKYVFDSITAVNFKPHPYVIGTRHVAHASDNFMGMLSEAAIKDLEKQKGPSCAYSDKIGHGRCMVPYAEHTYETAAFLKIKTDKKLEENKELPKFLFACKPTMEKEKITGFGLVKWKDDVTAIQLKNKKDVEKLHDTLGEALGEQ